MKLKQEIITKHIEIISMCCFSVRERELSKDTSPKERIVRYRIIIMKISLDEIVSRNQSDNTYFTLTHYSIYDFFSTIKMYFIQVHFGNKNTTIGFADIPLAMIL